MGDLTPGLALSRRDGSGPTVAFLSGYQSDMQGTKAVVLDEWAQRSGRGYVRFDYRGCGASPGAFEDFTLEDWFADALSVIDATPGPVVLVGSSMGGWLMLLAALVRPEKIVGLVGIAAAPDFTDWGYSDVEKAQLMRGHDVLQPSAYGEPMLTTARFWASGQALRLPAGDIAFDGAVRLLHGQADDEVPWRHSVDLAARLRSADVQVTLVKDGDHRLSRPQDIALLIAAIESLT
ncbi:alpha/beta fold hydrolase [Sphingomonas sp. SUN039]|uniref:alpha/beta fold hydrolase n=1 Tax=Sphingomonas sp. SUN039 TaxID=2937787 RepID=UPI0021649E22|nr:alpha/beta hydrolase [Sphingomonas sp. SUN039]UVO54966.1 alpha/beta hydrolase [Sphingomonas sp. SUN039]